SYGSAQSLAKPRSHLWLSRSLPSFCAASYDGAQGPSEDAQPEWSARRKVRVAETLWRTASSTEVDARKPPQRSSVGLTSGCEPVAHSFSAPKTETSMVSKPAKKKTAKKTAKK